MQPSELLDSDLALSEVMEREERLRALQSAGETAAGIVIDLSDDGPLAKYIRHRRAQAIEAWHNLAFIAPTNAVEIAQVQASVREYLSVCEWINSRIEESEQAEDIINQEFNSGDQD